MLVNIIMRQNSLLVAHFKNNIKVLSSARRYSTNNDEKFKGKYDVIIAGGGMVGCTLACAMGKNALLSNLKILLLEGSPNKKYELTPQYSNRVVALNQNTKSLMNSINVWEHVEAMRVQPVRHMQVWDACSDAMITFSSTDILDDDVAYIVENDVLLHAVTKELNKSKNIETVYQAKIAGYQLSQSQVSHENIVKMSNGDTYSCDLLIGADGANSAVRNAMGVQYVSWKYDHMGVVATLQLAEESENTTAWQRFLPTGPMALLPLNSKQSSLVWSTSPEHAKELLNLPEERFVDALNDALWKQYPRNKGIDACTAWVGSILHRLGLPDGAQRQLPPSICEITPNSRAAFPLAFGHSTKYIAPGVVLIGDAAHRVHPLAGQGVNLGFGDIKDLTELLSDALYSGLDITHSDWMQKYETARQRHNVPTQLCVDALYRLYSYNIPPFVLARSIGLQITNALHPVKKLLMSHATT
ncbi:ubiquinone biosynthesis monooxygenase COQ6, mitochondrial [Pieris rapae]|uniref:ubiquinone biosynthesis monooxygenase COQ6, mitochondrial n=1 Tax=Pieris rapae TaxID=64459 RepID=UPI001E27DC46|nr:ubiquinone biosynthesis monooxygenase COQ6, mitochondrial [Pieris rapae]